MGAYRHHAIIVTSWDEKTIEQARVAAKLLFGEVSSLVESKWNGFFSFLIPPDGSKEGWDPSFKGDRRRAKYIRWLRRRAGQDGSSSLHWVEIAYADDYGRPDEITDSNQVVDPRYTTPMTPSGEIPF